MEVTSVELGYLMNFLLLLDSFGARCLFFWMRVLGIREEVMLETPTE